MTIEDYLSSLAKRALVASEVESTGTSVLSGQGGRPWARLAASPPEHEGQPLFPILTLATSELPYVPTFLDPDHTYSFYILEDRDELSIEEGSLVVRRDAGSARVRPPRSGVRQLLGRLLPRRSTASPNPPRIAFSFREVLDYPCPEVLADLLADRPELRADFEANEDTLAEAYPCHAGVKLGGYPHLIQPTAFLKGLDPDFQIQIDCTSLYTHADSGIGYLCDGLTSMSWETM